MDWLSFAGSVLGGLIGAIISGIFTYLIARMEQRENRKIKNDDLNREYHINRPEFEIISTNKLEEYYEEKSNLDVLFIPIDGFDGTFMEYSKDLFDKEKMCKITYVLKNVGKTDISELWIVTGKPKISSVFEYNDFKYVYDDKGVLSYKVCYDKIIRQNDEVSISISCLKEGTIHSRMGSSLVLWFCDVNKNWWWQPLFFPLNKIYQSEKSTYSQFRKETDESLGLECFRNPEKW